MTTTRMDNGAILTAKSDDSLTDEYGAAGEPDAPAAVSPPLPLPATIAR